MKAWLLAAVLAMSAQAVHGCRLALAMALDVSGSVDMREYRLQADGLATALEDADVQSALFAIEGIPVALAVYEWSSSKYQRMVQDWVLIRSPGEIDALASKLRRWAREPAPEATGLGSALQFGRDLVGRAPPCWQATLDVSGDGQNNDWPTPRELKRRGSLGSLRINGL